MGLTERASAADAIYTYYPRPPLLPVPHPSSPIPHLLLFITSSPPSIHHLLPSSYSSPPHLPVQHVPPLLPAPLLLLDCVPLYPLLTPSLPSPWRQWVWSPPRSWRRSEDPPWGLSHTHTFTHTHSLTHSHTHIHTHTFTLTHSHTHIHSC